MVSPEGDSSSACRVAKDNSRVRENKSNAHDSAGNNLKRRKGSTSSAGRVAKSHHSKMMKNANANNSANNR